MLISRDQGPVCTPNLVRGHISCIVHIVVQYFQFKLKYIPKHPQCLCSRDPARLFHSNKIPCSGPSLVRSVQWCKGPAKRSFNNKFNFIICGASRSFSKFQKLFFSQSINKMPYKIIKLVAASQDNVRQMAINKRIQFQNELEYLKNLLPCMKICCNHICSTLSLTMRTFR